jgi:hypothetical protein
LSDPAFACVLPKYFHKLPLDLPFALSGELSDLFQIQGYSELPANVKWFGRIDVGQKSTVMVMAGDSEDGQSGRKVILLAN